MAIHPIKVDMLSSLALSVDVSPKWSKREQSVAVHYKMREIVGDDCLNEFDEFHSLRYLFTEEIRGLAAEHGFSLLQTGKWFSDEEPDDEDWSAIFTLKKLAS